MPAGSVNGYPFTAVVGMDDAKRALECALVNPNIHAVLLRGSEGSAKTVLSRAAAGLTDRKIINCPLNVTDEQLFGGLDIEEALKTGKSKLQPGLLSRAHNNILYIDDVNLMFTEEAIRAIGKYLPDCHKLIEQSKSIDGYVSELEQQIQEQERSIENANAYASAQRSRVRELNDQIWEYEQDLKKLQAQRDKAQKIVDAIPADVRAEIDKSMKKKGAKHYEYER